MAVGSKCLHVNMHDHLRKIRVKIVCEKIGEVGHSVPAALGMRDTKKIGLDDAHRNLTEKSPSDFGGKSQEQNRPARAKTAQISRKVTFKCALRAGLRKYRL